MWGKSKSSGERHSFSLSNLEPVVEALLLVIGAGAVFGVFFVPAVRHWIPLAPDFAAKLGEFSSGFFGPIFSLISIVLLVYTLRQQRASVVQQGFANKYFVMLEIHRENANQIIWHGNRGRRVFVLMVRELRSAIPYIQLIARDQGRSLTQRQIIHIAYYCFFYGVGPSSSRTLTMALKQHFDLALIEEIEHTLGDPAIKQEIRRQREFDFEPFRGHQSRLGHYYRHLYQLVNFVDEQDASVDKYDYVRTVRAQFSTHEQALLLLNSMCPLGATWWKRRFITRYKLVRNLPMNFFDKDTELNVEAMFDKDYFEWQDKD
ncbi:putative phage abortive infection protein [Granulicella cerasi]|uniref:Phage abortive infection protein n=1 Tax=Granulicella cerasi TaxID=741063 RepID=A0ABW1ZCK6_9BACT|nr:putative phage abortive infection protein [Granulicella cerasi]